MASDNHASYTRIGFTVVIGVAAILATLVYLGGLRGRGSELLVETCSDKPVSGLSVGSVVNFRGVKIGEVREIDFIGNKYDVKGRDKSRIYILMAIDGRLFGEKAGEDRAKLVERLRMMVDRLGLRATVTASGITGLSRIECDFNDADGVRDTPTISWTPAQVYVPLKMSLLDSFSDSATKVMNHFNRTDFSSVWSNVNTSVDSLARAAESVKVMFESRQSDLERLVDDLSSASSSIKDLAEELKRNPSLLIRERVATPLPETAR